MKYISKLLVLELLLICGTLSSTGQKLTQVSLVEFEPPYDKMIIDYRGKEIPITVNKDTKIKGPNGKIDFAQLNSGVVLDKLEFEIQGSNRVVKSIDTEFDPGGEVSFQGLLESVDGDLAIIDGRKVKLGPGGEMKGSKKADKCQCKGMIYTGFTDPLLEAGQYFLKVKGNVTGNGYILASEVEVCRNLFLQSDRELRDAVENSFSDKSVKVAELNQIFQEATTGMPLYQGQIQIGQYAYQLLNDIRLQGYINMVGERLIPDHQRNLSEDTPGKIFFRFYVIDNPIPNAFAFPNGMIFVHTGLLKVIENEAQLATVLGHEIAHVTHEHGRDRYETNSWTEFYMDLAKLGADYVNFSGVNLNANLMGQINSLTDAITPSAIGNVVKPQPKRECQADRVGVFYAYQAGYDIREGAKLWQNMANLTGKSDFQSKLKDNVMGMLGSTKMRLAQNPLQYLGKKGTELLMSELLNTIYTSHPKAKNRAHEIGSLVSTYYQEENFDAYVKGGEEYKEFVK